MQQNQIDYIPPQYQVTGHVSQETALQLDDSYMLNGILTPIRYWVETNPSYGQRVVRQIFNSRGCEWFNPKPMTNYAQLVLLFCTFAPLDPTEQVRFGTNIVEPVMWSLFNLHPSVVKDEDIDGFARYYRFDEYQQSIIAKYKHVRLYGEVPQEQKPEPKVAPSRTRNPELAELRRIKAELEQEKIRALRLRNEEKEIQLAERKLKLEGKTAEPALKRKRNETDEDYQVRLIEDQQRKEKIKRQELKVFEEQNGLKLTLTLPKNGVYDKAVEENLRPEFNRIVQYCDANPDYVPTDVRLFKVRAENLGIDVSRFPFFSLVKTGRETVAQGVKEVDLSGLNYNPEDEAIDD